MKKTSMVLAISFCGVLLFAGMGSNPEETIYKEGQKIKVAGVLRLVGNEPFTRLSIRVTLKTNHLDIYLPNEVKKTCQDLVARDVEAEGLFHMETFYSADHKYKFREYILSNVTEVKEVPSTGDKKE